MDKRHELRKMVLTVNEVRAEEGYEALEGPLGDAPLNPSLVGPWMQLSQAQPPDLGEGPPGQEEEGDQQGDPQDQEQDAGEDQGEAPGNAPGGQPEQEAPEPSQPEENLGKSLDFGTPLPDVLVIE